MQDCYGDICLDGSLGVDLYHVVVFPRHAVDCHVAHLRDEGPILLLAWHFDRLGLTVRVTENRTAGT